VGGLPFSIDRGDLLWAFAPKPLLVCYTTHDVGMTYSPVYEESTKEIYQELQSVYVLLGAKDHVGLYASHLPHNMDFFQRTQTYGWFNRWLGNPNAGSEEAEFEVFPEERLHATSTGQVLTSIGGRSVVQLNRDRAQKLTPASPFRSAGDTMGPAQQEIYDGLVKLLALPQQRQPLQSRVRSSNPRKGVVIEEIQFESQPGIRIPGWFLTPSPGSRARSTVLYRSEGDRGDTIVEEPSSMDGLLAAGHAVYAISLRGLGITTPRLPNRAPRFYDGGFRMDENYTWTSLILGSPVIGQRVWDALRAIDYLASRADVDPSQIRLLGAGSAGIVALMAGFLDKRPRSVLVDRTLVTYASIIHSADYSLNLSWFVPGILRSFDLPDIAAGLSPRPCWILNGAGPSGQVLPETSVREQYRRRLDESAFAHVRFIVSPEREAQDRYLEWLKST
jgi:hypothetical protein